MMLVLPVLMVVFLGLATVGGLFLDHVAVGQAAQQGLQTWAEGQSSRGAEADVNRVLASQGISGASITASRSSNVRTLRVSVPVRLWNTGKTATVTASRSMASLPAPGQSPPPQGPPVTTGGGGGGGGTTIIYHHFPMW